MQKSEQHIYKMDKCFTCFKENEGGYKLIFTVDSGFYHAALCERCYKKYHHRGEIFHD